MELSSEHKALFSLLRAGLWEREPDDLSPFPLTDAQWWNVYRMAVRQTVTGIVCRGLHHLPEALLPGDALMIRWVAETDRIERKNRRMDAVVCLLAQRMGRNGLHPVLLKGQGVAAFYEHPLTRECGDIDLCFLSEEEEREAAELMRRVGCRTEKQPDGSNCYSWQGVEVEHHTRLFDLHNPLLKVYLSALVREHGFTEFRPGGRDGLPEGNQSGEFPATISVPSPLPNLLLLNAHLLKHLLGHGVGLRQFCDMARAYHTLCGSYSPEGLEAVHRRTGLLRWSAQLHTFLTEYLGLHRAELPYADTDAYSSPELLRIVLEGGNFGQYGGTKGKASQARWERKLRTFLSFWKHRGFSSAYARKEAFWISVRLIIGNLR